MGGASRNSAGQQLSGGRGARRRRLYAHRLLRPPRNVGNPELPYIAPAMLGTMSWEQDSVNDYMAAAHTGSSFVKAVETSSPPKNGESESMIQTHNMKARAMILDSQLPPILWAEAINTANYLHARSPTTANKGMTPYQKLYGRKPEVSLASFRMYCLLVVASSPTTWKIHLPCSDGLYAWLDRFDKGASGVSGGHVIVDGVLLP